MYMVLFADMTKCLSLRGLQRGSIIGPFKYGSFSNPVKQNSLKCQCFLQGYPCFLGRQTVRLNRQTYCHLLEYFSQSGFKQKLKYRRRKMSSELCVQ